MCSINGFFSQARILSKQVEPIFREMVLNSTVRGRDSAGIAILNEEGEVALHKTLGHPGTLKFSLNDEDFIAINNCRAEPTTEYIEEKCIEDIQPYTYNGVYAVHNGTIPNDKEILKSIDPPTRVDSFAIPYAVATNKFNMLKGSISTAYFDVEDKVLTLYKNYTPLSLFYVKNLKTYFFTSLPESFKDCKTIQNLGYEEIAFPQFSEICISKDSVRTRVEHRNNDKAIVILSGGLDSTTTAKLVCHKHSEITLAHFHYGCRAQTRETESVTRIAERLKNEHPDKKIDLTFIDLSFLQKLGGSTLTDTTQKVGVGEAAAEDAIDWVPFRNGVMVALIGAYCDKWDIGHIYLGQNLEEGLGGYRDNQITFFRALTQAFDIGSMARPIIHGPLDCLMKHEIVQLALHIRAPIDFSWSCYHGDEKPCGECGPCFLRSRAFKMNHVMDMLEYKKLPQSWNGCEPFNASREYGLSAGIKELLKEYL